MPYRFLRFPEGKSKAVTFSYDDGSQHDAQLLGILNRFGIKCTFNLNSGRLLSGAGLSIDQVKGLLSDGHEAAIHGARHQANGISAPIDGIRDVLSCREALEKTFGRIIRGLAYPDSGITRFANGSSYETVRNYLRALGIVYARTVSGDNDSFQLPGDWYAWTPTAHHANPRLPEYMDKFLALEPNRQYCDARHPRLFYLWGHAHEFQQRDNWALLEEICARLGGKEDIWYATNMEIYDYSVAYDALVWSADGALVYNPTLIPVWFIVGETVFHIRPGETISVAE